MEINEIWYVHWWQLKIDTSLLSTLDITNETVAWICEVEW
jgi:hypothetical protein